MVLGFTSGKARHTGSDPRDRGVSMRLRMEEPQEVGCRGGVALHVENTGTTFLIGPKNELPHPFRIPRCPTKHAAAARRLQQEQPARVP